MAVAAGGGSTWAGFGDRSSLRGCAAAGTEGGAGRSTCSSTGLRAGFAGACALDFAGSFAAGGGAAAVGAVGGESLPLAGAWLVSAGGVARAAASGSSAGAGACAGLGWATTTAGTGTGSR